MREQQFWIEEELGERLETHLAKLRTLHLKMSQLNRNRLKKTTESAVNLFQRALKSAS